MNSDGEYEGKIESDFPPGSLSYRIDIIFYFCSVKKYHSVNRWIVESDRFEAFVEYGVVTGFGHERSESEKNRYWFCLRYRSSDGSAKSQFFVVRASSLHDLYCRQDACTTMGSHTRVKPILFAGSSSLYITFLDVTLDQPCIQSGSRLLFF